jgi:tetratricopeptide (TPR) repeat protein
VAQEASEDLSWLEGIEQEESVPEPEAEAAPASEWVPAESLPAQAEPSPAMLEEEVPGVPELAAETAAEAEGPSAPEAEEMPDWLKASLEEPEEPAEEEALPEWMATAAVLKAATSAEEEAAEPAPEPEPVLIPVPQVSEEEPGPGIEVARPTPPEGDQAMFEQAQIDLQRGNLDEAAAGYSRLIKRGKMLDEIIHDLREGTYRHPVDVIVWMTLGDAYKRANRLQEALDAYTKGEELLR